MLGRVLQKKKVQNHDKGNNIPIVNSEAISKVMNSTFFSYPIFYNDVNTSMHKESMLMHDDNESSLQTFLKRLAGSFARPS